MKQFKEKLGDSYGTPQWLFDELNEEFNFDIDLCATKDNSKCINYCKDYLLDILDERSDIEATNTECSFIEYIQSYKDVTCFMNPPYSNPYPFVKKAWEDSKYCKIVLVLSAKTNTKWWRVFWDSDNHKPYGGCKVRFIPYRRHHKSRVAFVNPETGKEQSGNTCGTSIIIFDRRDL